MGAERKGRALTLLAVAVVILAPSIAVAKTLEGTKNVSEPPQGAVAGPPATGTVAPMLVPPSTAPGTPQSTALSPAAGPVSPPVGAGAGADEEPDTGEASAPERGSESGLPSDSAGTSPARRTPSTGEGQPTAVSSVAPGNAGSTNAASTTTRLATLPAAPRPAGPRIPLPPGTDAKPSAFALRDQPATASSVVPEAGTRAAAGADPTGATANPATTAPSPPASLAGAARQPGTDSFVSCATLPSPGPSNDRIVWTSARTAEITAGRDLRSAERVSALSGTSVIWDPSSPVEAYVLHPDTFAVMARFTASGAGSDELIGFLDQPLPGLQISECDGRPAPGIAPGTYLLRYAFKGTVTSASTVASEIFVSPPVSVRVIAGPTAPALAPAPTR